MRTPLSLCALALALSLAFCHAAPAPLQSRRPPRDFAAECCGRELTLEWAGPDCLYAARFWPDGTCEFSNRRYAARPFPGLWRCEGGAVTVEEWLPPAAPHSGAVPNFAWTLWPRAGGAWAGEWAPPDAAAPRPVLLREMREGE